MLDIFTSTIAAVSTPPGKGGIAVIRISGPDTVRIVSGVFRSASGISVQDLRPRRVSYGEIVGLDGNVCDTGLLTVFRAPASFTGEDCAEISCHGGVAVTKEVLSAVIGAGAVPAGPGEFTRRAFSNGKLSLSEAEAVGLLIDADTKEKMQLSGNAARGSLSRELAKISGGLSDTMTALYAAVDYPEEDVGDEGEREIHTSVSKALLSVNRLLDTYSLGRAVTEGVKCVICGKPNVGKSSVFNLLTGEDSAIVTDIPGTTRDVLRESVSCGGVTLRLSDTAGIRQTSEQVEAIGVGKAVIELESADLIIAVFDSSEKLDGEDLSLIEKLKSLPSENCPVISVVNKDDLPPALSEADLADIDSFSSRVIRGSARTGPDSPLLQDISSAVSELFNSGHINVSHDAVIWDVRQRDMLGKARSSLEEAKAALDRGDPVDCICSLVEEALAFLDDTDGRNVDQKIVDQIFSRFCVGK